MRRLFAELTVAPDGAPAPVQAVIFDLDGTLVQTRIASWKVFRPISEEFGLGITRPEQYFDLFRGNVYASIRELCRDEAHSEQVKEAFLTRLREDYRPALIPGMADVVRRLAGRYTLAVMSSNAMHVLRRVLTEHGLAFCFAHVFGGDVAPDKRAAIRQFLADDGSGVGRRCAADYDEAGPATRPEPGRTVLVTDTAGDVRDAHAEGIRVVGVAWGMHTVDELTAAGAEFVAYWPQELSVFLLGATATEAPGGACNLQPPAPSEPRRPPETGCGCGCNGSSQARDEAEAALRTTADRRRDRRRQAALALQPRAADAGTAAPSHDIVEAVRRICGAARHPPRGHETGRGGLGPPVGGVQPP